jgi:cytochrome c-type biogenesis protein CcmH/NrfF
MVTQYGPGILASPGDRGFAITAWLVPVAGLLAATLAIAGVVVLGRRRREAYERAMSVPPATADEDAALDAALKALDTRQ